MHQTWADPRNGIPAPAYLLPFLVRKQNLVEPLHFDGSQNPCLNAVRSPPDKSLVALKHAAEQRQQSLDEEWDGHEGEGLHEEVEAVLKGNFPISAQANMNPISSCVRI